MTDISLADLHQGERELLERALGLDNSPTSTRNFIQAEEEEYPAWEALIDKGLAFAAPSRLHLNRCFSVTLKGRYLFGVWS